MRKGITIFVERCTMQIYPDVFFAQTSFTNQKRLLGYVFREPWRNEEAISILGAYLSQKQAEAKEAWRKASVAYQNGFRLNSERNNQKLLSAVKRSKSEYERWGKLLTHFETLKTKSCV